MYQGHYGPAGVIHFLYTDISFPWLIISTQIIDIAYFILVYCCKLFCNMDIQNCPYPIVCSEYTLYNADLMRAGKPFPFSGRVEFTHSLTGALALTLPFTLLYQYINGRGKRSFASLYSILLLGVSSHWLLDTLVHRPDMAILPPLTKTLVGYGTWQDWSIWSNVEYTLCG